MLVTKVVKRLCVVDELPRKFRCFRFHLVTAVASYVFGCIVCYYALNLCLIQRFVEQIACRFVKRLPKEGTGAAPNAVSPVE